MASGAAKGEGMVNFRVKGEGMGSQTLHCRMNVAPCMVAKTPCDACPWPPHINRPAIHINGQQVFRLPNAKYNREPYNNLALRGDT